MIYFIEAKEFARIKIGYSSRVSSRAEALQKQAPTELVQLLTIQGGPAEEAKLHRIFKSARAYGEWFNATPDLREFIEELRSASHPLDVIEAAYLKLEPSKRKRAATKSAKQKEYEQTLLTRFVAHEGWSERDFRAAGEDLRSLRFRAMAWASEAANLHFNPPEGGDALNRLSAEFASINEAMRRAAEAGAERIAREKDPAYLLSVLSRAEAGLLEARKSLEARVPA